MISFHEYSKKRLIRVNLQHYDAINDLIIKEYQSVDEQISFITCSKDNTLRLWNTFLGDPEIKMMMKDQPKAVEGDLKRTVFLDLND